MVHFLAHPSPDYPPRTKFNIDKADFTVAFGINFETAGEQLTWKLSMPRYVRIDLMPLNSFVRNREINKAAYKIVSRVDPHPILNIAGNSLVNLRGIPQHTINRDVFAVLQLVHHTVDIKKIVCGGQTGADWAGVVAAKLLDIPCDVTMPRGFRQRGADGKDCYSTVGVLRTRLKMDCQKLGEEVKLL
jgi:hypothetical protein